MMIDSVKLRAARRAEDDRFVDTHRNSAELSKQAQRSMLAGVPMPWMTRWPGAHPVFVERASGARFTDVDGNEYVDFCLGDTGAMTGHALPAVADAISNQARRGLTTMLPTPDSIWVADDLARRFGLPKWQFTLSATDANRFVLRLSRHLTKRSKIVVHDWCYHGTVDESLVVLDQDGRTVSRRGAIGPQVDPSLTTRAVPFNDLASLEAALANLDVACVLMEPALTNIGIVLPESGYHSQVRQLTRRYGALLAIDETHTISAGPGGCTQAWGLDPDFVVIGKTIGGGVPVGAFGMSADIASKLSTVLDSHEVDVSGIGGTLSGSALAMAAMRATLTHSLLKEQFEYSIPLASRWAAGVETACAVYGLDWHVQQLGCRVEYWFCPPPLNGADAAAAVNPELEGFLHLFALNRGVLLAPFHNMALMSAFHVTSDIDLHSNVFSDSLSAIVS
jgi:glutamate-1-semialdehyde 2,1-aminomutase